MTRSKGVQAGLAAGTLVALITFCSISGIALGQKGANSGNNGGNGGNGGQVVTDATNTPNSAPGVVEATNVPTATATATAIPKPIPTATPKPAPQPTNTPAPACDTGGAPLNPWCYTFANTGKYITNPQSNFCDYFNCIKSFWTSTNGYVDECNDGTYSHSGGVRGACSYHGGELRPLYAP